MQRSQVHGSNQGSQGTPREEISTIPSLATAMEELQGQHIVMGDFNLHHPMWSTDTETKYAQAVDLVSLITHFALHLGLLAGTSTFRDTPNHQSTSIDLVLLSTMMANRVMRCTTEEELSHDSDHLAITCEIALRVKEQPDRHRYY